jgi:hypothetical protein
MRAEGSGDVGGFTAGGMLGGKGLLHDMALGFGGMITLLALWIKERTITAMFSIPKHAGSSGCS